MDALSDVLQAVRLTGGVFLDAHFTAPWCVLSKIGPEDCRPFLAQPRQVISYHHVIDGRMIVTIDGEAPKEVGAGETVLVPRNDAHLLGSAAGLRPVTADGLVQPPGANGLARIVHGGGGAPTHIVCGFLGSDQQRNPLIATLPRLLKVDMTRAGSGAWIESSLQFAVRRLSEGKVGDATVMSRLSEAMFIEAVRSYVQTLPAGQTGWLAGMRDSAVGRAIALVHGRIDHGWTAEDLAREVGLSRSAFTDRFTALVGMPPKRYVTFWRLETAKEKLRDSDRTVAQVAYDVGYEAEAAFNRAFKREFGLPPAAWRKQAQEPKTGL